MLDSSWFGAFILTDFGAAAGPRQVHYSQPENLGVHIPPFSKNLKQIPVYLAVFTAMTAIWCAIGYWLVRHRLLGHYSAATAACSCHSC